MTKARKSERSQPRGEQLLALLRREQGASVDDIMAATRWLPHTARAALTGLRKKGAAIEKQKVDGVTRYFVAVEPAA